MATEEIGARLSLKDRRQFSTDANRAARDVEGIGNEAAKSERKARGLGSTLSSLGKGVKALGGLAIRTGAIMGGVAAAGIGAFATMGIKAFSSAEQAEISFTTMLGSAKKAQAFLAQLEDFAAKTPFEMQGLTQSAQGLLAFGFAAKDVLPMMTAIGDASAALGAGDDGMDRMVRAMGQIQAKGKASAEDLMQLAELGVPVWDMLAKKLGTDVPTAMKKVSKGQVDAKTTIDALLTGMNARFGGLMAKQATSVGGLWSTLQDNVRIASKRAIEPFGDDIKRVMTEAVAYLDKVGDWMSKKFPGYVKNFRKRVPELTSAFKSGDANEFAVTLDGMLGGTGKLVGPLHEVYSAGKDLWTVFSQLLLPVVKDLTSGLPSFVTPLGAARDLLGWMADNARALQPWLKGIILAWIAWRTAVILHSAAVTVHTGIMKVHTAWTKIATAAGWAHETYQRVARSTLMTWVGVKGIELAAWIRSTAATVAHTVATLASAAAMKVVRGAVIAWTVVQRALNTALFSNPIGLVVLAIVALVAIFIVAYKHSETFRNIVNGAFHAVLGAAQAVWSWLQANWPLLLAILTGPIGWAVLVIAKNWDSIMAGATAVKNWIVGAFNSVVDFFTGLPGRISAAAVGLWDGLKDAFKGVINFIIDAWNSLDFGISLTVPDWVPGVGGKGWHVSDVIPDLPRLHTGGQTTAGGAAIIQPDEEMVVLPPAASVIPTPAGQVPAEALGGGQPSGPIVVPVYIDGKKVAEAVWDHTRDEVARR